jgi:microcystin-dependent protein
MSCSNCYNGCTDITSDKCVKYTGVDVPALGIVKGDSLSFVEQALITFLTEAINGTGIAIEIDEADYCEVVSQYLQACETVTALDLFTALVKAACSLQTQIDTIDETLDTLNADYDVDCLEGVTNASDTHAVVQAVIDKVCAVDEELGSLALDLETNYVAIADLNGYIAEYLESTEGATRYSSRMVPYSIVPYYGALGVFDATGAGLPDTEWEDIYLCNGSNGTPDLRGRALVGAINGVPGGAMSSTVDPASSAFNPSYSIGTLAGANSVVLTEDEIPAHTHELTDPGHTHVLAVDETSSAGPLSGSNNVANAYVPGADGGYELQNASGEPDAGEVADADTGITIAETGGGEAHSNIQPVIATYFIMYIPA